MRLPRPVGCVPLLLLLSACAFDVSKVERMPATLSVADHALHPFLLRTSVEVTLDSGYRRTLVAATRWSPVGRLPQGAVFRTDDQVLTVEGSNIYEAYLVLDGARLVGFYLPADAAYTALPKPVPLDLVVAGEDR